MKVPPLAVILVAAGSLVAAQSHHRHQHRHLHVPRAPDGETYYVYELNGESIPQDQACNGIQYGDLEYADGNAPPGACGPGTSVPQSTAEKAAAFHEAPPTTSASSTSTSTSSTSSSTSTTSSAPAPPAYTPAPSNQPSNSGGNGVNSEFPDGQLDCRTFPSDYGPIPLTYLGFNGWSGLQQVTMSGGQASNIVTGVSGDNCQDGYMCSYACPPVTRSLNGLNPRVLLDSPLVVSHVLMASSILQIPGYPSHCVSLELAYQSAEHTPKDCIRLPYRLSW